MCHPTQSEIHPIMTRKKYSGPMSATEFMAELAQDEEYQRKKAAFDADLQERAAVWTAAERPIVADLQAAGIEVDSPWDLVHRSVPYPEALPVLLAHLQRAVLDVIARRAFVRPS